MGRRGRPRKDEELTAQEFLKPVSISFLAKVLSKDRKTIEKRLQGLAPVATDDGSLAYNFAQAAERVFASQPAPGGRLTAAALANMKPDELPLLTQAIFWDGQKKRVEFRRAVNDLFRATDFQNALDEVVKVFRDGVLALNDQIPKTQRAGIPLQRVLDDLLMAVEDKATKAVRALNGQSVWAEYALMEEQAEAEADVHNEAAQADHKGEDDRPE
ncbi:hypothetical protein IX56_00405 [Paracoccus sanguinis]|uniref:Terminase small subunit n=2 Tax=Paracoccus sanguinis TaxID=1545044 RepID=A0A099GLN5_9RHOB|nr:hypothetical protein IX56_00405 [Paracoccus sanguinis]